MVPRRLALYEAELCCWAVAVAEVVEGGRGPSEEEEDEELAPLAEG